MSEIVAAEPRSEQRSEQRQPPVYPPPPLPSVRPRLVEELAERAALEISGVIAVAPSRMRRMFQSKATAARAVVGRRSTNITIEIGVSYPCSIIDVAGDVRNRIRQVVTDALGIVVGQINVWVVYIENESAPTITEDAVEAEA